MAISTYSDLKTLTANYLARSDLTDQIADFIQLSEIRLQRDLRLRQMLTTADLSISSASVSLPSDFLELREIHLDTATIGQLDYLAPTAFFRNARINDAGQPVFYTMTGTKFDFAPSPDTTYTAKILYYAKPDLLSDSNTSNVFLSDAPDCLLYGALAEAEPYLMNDQRITVWAAMYDRSKAALNAADDRSEFAGNPMTMTVS